MQIEMVELTGRSLERIRVLEDGVNIAINLLEATNQTNTEAYQTLVQLRRTHG